MKEVTITLSLFFYNHFLGSMFLRKLLHPLPSIHVGQPRRSWDFFKRTLPRNGLGGDSQVFQTANHFELEEGRDHREQVEYTSHRVDVSPVRSTFQLQFENPRITLKQYMYSFYLFQCVSRSAGGRVSCVVEWNLFASSLETG